MAGAPEWTKSENLAIYMFLEKYPHKSSEEIAEKIFNNSLLKITSSYIEITWIQLSGM